ncbi:hypothetical protein LIER_21348 [Lithospermum erythrorhizon]|uniref:Uncharacterized protein n=1 Tax=Lithospermum erythrorhizon TaxID=34254 RepID=A0AAV3QR38_LITER
MSKGVLPVKYFRVLLSSRNLTSEDYSGLIDKICSKIGSWQSTHLSLGGRADLIRSSIFGIQNFCCASIPLPKYVTEEVERRVRCFLWSGKGKGSYRAKVSWYISCLPLAEGGLGFKIMFDWNQACLCKLCGILLLERRSCG